LYSPKEAKYEDERQGEGTLFGPDYEHAKTDEQNGSPELGSERRHIGTVIISVASSSTIRDFPVPDEFTMVACLA